MGDRNEKPAILARPRPQLEFLLASNDTKCVNASSGKTAEAIMNEEFEELAGVERVMITREGSIFSIDIDMSVFDRDTRRRVYAKEQKLYNDFPKYSFNIHLNDRSRRHVAIINAVQE